jgi:YesN/AraC family two-component response regulator
VVKADNGLVAYEKSLSQKFDFIIMDINMPVMDGVEAGKKILEHYNQKSFMRHSHIADHQSINHLTNIIPSSSCSSLSKAP